MSSIKSGLIWNTLHQFCVVGINFLSLMVLSRMLSTEDYGTYGILVIFISISEMLTDSGMGGYIVKMKNASQEHYSTLFVYNMAMSLLLYFLIFFSAPLIAKIYNNHTLISYLRILGIVIIINAFSITQYTKLLKNLCFKRITIAGISASMLGMITAIVLAYNGKGVWALIGQQIVNLSVLSLIYVVMTREIPRLSFKYSLFKKQFGFGIYLFSSSVLKTIIDNICNNINGKFFSLKSTGAYTQANKLQSYPVAIISNIVDRTFFPIFSKINDNIERLCFETRRIRRMMYATLFPLFTLLYCYATEIVTLALGEKWAESVIYFQILIVASIPMLVKAINRNFIKSLGKTSYIFYVELFTAVALVFSCFMAVSKHSIIYIAISYVVCQYISGFISILYSARVTKVNSVKNQIIDVLTFCPIILIPVILSKLELQNIPDILLSSISLLCMVTLYITLGNKEYRTVINVAEKFIYHKK